MQSMDQTVEGVVVAFAVRAFESFTDDAGAVVPAGTIRALWVVSDFGTDPTEIRVSASEARQCEGLEYGMAVTAKCRIFARGSALSLRLVSIEVPPRKTGRDAAA